MKKSIHLICSAHLDPVWLWEWQEGAAEAISTFRTAVELCEENEIFIFNHNEVILYEWVEEYDPILFERIKKQVKKGRWHIMGGWYLQPDCNMPSGESFVRQILIGRKYFKKKFGVKPTTAMNFDPFGHSRGLVQVLAKSGYDSYLFGRPQQRWLKLKDDLFSWVGFDGSQILAKRFRGWYNTQLGKAKKQIAERIQQSEDSVTEVLWGVGNHGGGPSRKDLSDINRMLNCRKEIKICHSTPEAYFEEVRNRSTKIEKFQSDLNPWGIGCYTSMMRIKQMHRKLENEMYLTEKMVSSAVANGLIEYPSEDLAGALKDLMFVQFHDILPGSSVQSVEEASLHTIGHGMEILAKIKTRSFFALTSGQKKAKNGLVAILVYNPHPHKIKNIVECEFNLPDVDYEGLFNNVKMFRDGKEIPIQIEKESSNLETNWRKKAVFRCDLKPNQMNRFDCVVQKTTRKCPSPRIVKNGKIIFNNSQMTVAINTKTGFVDQYKINGIDILGKSAFCPVVHDDNQDSWEMRKIRFGKAIGKFKLLNRIAGAKFNGIKDVSIESVRVIEDGDVRTVVEAVFGFEESFICQRYKLPKEGTEIEVEIRVYWNQKDRLLKLKVPLAHTSDSFIGQTAFGIQKLPLNGNEAVAQKWIAVLNKREDICLSCINDGIYGSDFCGRTLRLTLLRSPKYSGHPVGHNRALPEDRFIPRIDQGERLFRFWINGGTVCKRLNNICSEALHKNEKPYALAFFPSGDGKIPRPFAILDKKEVEISAIKKAEDNGDWIIRLFNSGSRKKSVMLKLPVFKLNSKLSFGPFEIKTLRLNDRNELLEVDLMEEDCQ
jgi:alpha-mannosidase